MNVSINCRCGTQFTIQADKVKKLSSFSCPVCNRNLPKEHIEKIKNCLSLIEECHVVHAPKATTTGIVDLGYDFTVNFVE